MTLQQRRDVGRLAGQDQVARERHAVVAVRGQRQFDELDGVDGRRHDLLGLLAEHGSRGHHQGVRHRG